MADQISELISEQISESEAMYLITIARLIEDGIEEPISLPVLAEALSILPVSANQMIHKLSESGLVEYFAYKGVAFTPQGRLIARHILRHRRLWEVFLVNCLQLPPSEAERLACDLEHITPPAVADRLSAFLDNPRLSPQGKPIPSLDGASFEDFIQPLSGLAIGGRGEVTRIEGDLATRAFLESEDIRPGSKVIVLGSGSQGALLVKVGQRRVFLSDEVAENIIVMLQQIR